MDFDFSWIIILLAIGIVSGTWGALIGAGGGFIIVPFLLIFLDNQNPPVPVSSITAISLAAVCINGISSFIGYLRLKRIDFKLGLIFLLASIPSAIAGAIFVNKIGNQFFQFLFGGILIAVALYLIFKPKIKENTLAKTTGLKSKIIDSKGTLFTYVTNLKIGTPIIFSFGFLSGMLGIGGGIFNVPAFVILLRIPIEIATATSIFILVGTSLVANITNLLQGDLSGYYSIVLSICVGSFIGGQIGTKLAKRITSLWIARVLSFTLILVGIRLITTDIIKF